MPLVQTSRLIGYGPDAHLTRPGTTPRQAAALTSSWTHWRRVRGATAVAAGVLTGAAILGTSGPGWLAVGATPVLAWAMAAAMALVVVARNGALFLMAWEMMARGASFSSPA